MMVAVRSEVVSTNDPVLVAFEDFEEILNSLLMNVQVLKIRRRELRSKRLKGQSVWEIVSSDVAGGQPFMPLLSSVLWDLSRGSSQLRKALVMGLRDEGETIQTIAQLFGVTHQRISNIIRHVAKEERQH